MPRQFKAARKLNHLKVTEAAQRLQVSQPTLSAWEGERKSPNIENLEKMAELYSVTTDFLLGRADPSQLDELVPVPNAVLRVMNGKPVWSEKFGWMLVCSEGGKLICSDGNEVVFSDVGDVFTRPQPYAEAGSPLTAPLGRDELVQRRRIWVEPISKDANLREELRGWYFVRDSFIENDAGNRFMIDDYGARWLAFEKN